MNELPADCDRLDALATEFVDRQRRGETPTIDEYAARSPDIAHEIRELFPMISMMETLKRRKEQPSGGRASLGAARPERIGDFRILGEIGRGGMGIVYEAVQESLHRRVAVKVLPRPATLDERRLARFHREAQTAAGLHHTNIVQVFGVGEHDGLHYYVMQLIDGVGLDRVLERLARDGESVVAGNSALSAASALRAAVTTRSVGSAGETRSVTRSESDAIGQSGAIGQSDAIGQSGESMSSFDVDVEREAEFDLHAEGTGRSAGWGMESRAARKTPKAISRTPDAPSHAPSSIAPKHTANSSYWHEVARLGIQAAEALEYAHQRGTVHRDIKPANLILDTDGNLWIADFGLARAVDDAAASQSGDLIGTIRYMSPEALRGRPTASSDQYSLGLTLYELLTFRPAYSGDNKGDVMQRVLVGEIAPPRRIQPRIPRDLETIVLKASACEPRDRYPSAGALADDLRSFVADRPIAARRVHVVERLWRWSRRNRSVAALSAVSIGLLLTVAAVATWGYVRTRDALQGERDARARAESVANLASSALDRIFNRFAPDPELSERSTQPPAESSDDDARPLAEPAPEVSALLQELVVFYDELAARQDGDPEFLQRAAEARQRVGALQSRLGRFDEARVAFEQAAEDLETLGDHRESDRELAEVRIELGRVLASLGMHKEAHEAFRDAIDLLEAERLRHPDDPSVNRLLAMVHHLDAMPFHPGAMPPRGSNDGPRPPAPPHPGRPSRHFGPPGPNAGGGFKKGPPHNRPPIR